MDTHTVPPRALADATDLRDLVRKSQVDAGLAGKVDTGDARLTDARPPTAHSHTLADVTGLQAALDAKAAAAITANTQTASYTLVLADAGKAVEMNVATANNVTVPPNSSVAFPVGTVVEVVQYGAGVTTVAAGSGVTIRTGSTLICRARYSTVSLRKRATDEWVLAGDTS